MTTDQPQALRARLVEIDDELRALAGDAFAEKHALNLESDELRAQLDEAVGDDAQAAAREWAERAGRKGEHTQDVEQDEGRARVIGSAPNLGA